MRLVHLLRPSRLLFSLVPLLAAACVSASEEDVASQQLGWDSAENNPTHATHSYLTEHAIAVTRGELPEVDAYREAILRGANAELHELPIDDGPLEALRVELGGNNWACDRPERLWTLALDRYAAGDRAGAYFHVGLLLHYVEDMGVPAHAFHVIHQGSLTEFDNFELLGLEKWDPDFRAVDRADPALTTPVGYVELSGAWAKAHFERTWPGRGYAAGFFSKTWVTASSKERSFVRARGAMTATATAWALRRAAGQFATKSAGGRGDGITVPVAEGYWGSWTVPASCAPGSWVQGLRLRVERSQGRSDDTGLNAISLRCASPAASWLTPHEGFWGDWGNEAACPGGGFAIGAAIKMERPQGDGDDTAANDVQLLCENGGRAAATHGGSFGTWESPVYCPAGTAVCGASVRMETKQGNSDDTALNGLRLVCCPR